MRLFVSAVLALLIVAVVGFVLFSVWASGEAVRECKSRGFARGDYLVNGDIVCYHGEVISRR